MLSAMLCPTKNLADIYDGYLSFRMINKHPYQYSAPQIFYPFICHEQSWALAVLFNYFYNKNDIFALFIKLI